MTPGPLESETTAQSTVPQSLPHYCIPQDENKFSANIISGPSKAVRQERRNLPHRRGPNRRRSDRQNVGPRTL